MASYKAHSKKILQKKRRISDEFEVRSAVSAKMCILYRSVKVLVGY